MARVIPLDVNLVPTGGENLPESSPSGAEHGREGQTPRGAVVIDVLRATTTLTRAFDSGLREARFFATPEAAMAARKLLPGDMVILGGEREGKRLQGFDLGNSPGEYHQDRVSGKTLLYASTNGSLAFLSTVSAARQWAVSFVNLQAAVEIVALWLHSQPLKGALPTTGAGLEIVCSGKLGKPAAEDSACAALFADRLVERLPELDLAVEVSGSDLPVAPRSERDTLDLLRNCEHGRYLASLGSEGAKDVDYCSRWNLFNSVPTGGRGILNESLIPEL